jgi:hypothetical protein
MLAGEDRILDNPGTRKYLTRLRNARSVTVIDYPHAEHTLEFESVDFVGDAVRWVGRVVL